MGGFKDYSTGEFSRNDDRPITPANTIYLSYTANCFTYAQGGYEVKYCFANKTKHGLDFTFSDGLPAYASEFFVHIMGDSFYFRPQTAYPTLYPGQKISHQVTRKTLTLNKSNYSIGEVIIGYVDIKFIETVSVSNRGAQKHTFYFEGLHSYNR